MATAEAKHDRGVTPLNDSRVPNQTMATAGTNSRTSMVQVYVPSQQLMMLDGEKTTTNPDKPVRTTGLTNSSRWSDPETRHLLEVWRSRYPALKSRKRNFKEWEIISREFNKRCANDGVAGLGPRTGAQCKIRIKNIIADYKRAKGQYHGNISRQLFPYYDMISEILARKTPEQGCEEFEDFEGDDEVKPDEIVQLPLTSEIIDTQDVVMATMTVPIQTPTSSLPVPVSVHSLAMPTHVDSLIPPSLPVISTMHNSQQSTPLSFALSPVPVAPAAALGSVHTTALSGADQESPRLLPKSSYVHSATMTTLARRLPEVSETFVPKKTLRKNPRPVKVVKVTRQSSEDDRLLMVVREFMSESRKREEELFDKLFQQQAQAEQRYQEFTLNVIREIGKLFKPGASQ